MFAISCAGSPAGSLEPSAKPRKPLTTLAARLNPGIDLRVRLDQTRSSQPFCPSRWRCSMIRQALLTLTFLAVATVASAGEAEIRVPKGARTVPDSYIVVLDDAAVGAGGISGLAVPQVADEMARRHGG